MTDPAEGGESHDDASNVAVAQPEAPAGTSTKDVSNQPTQPKGGAASGASEPSQKKADPPAQPGKAPADTKTGPQSKAPLKKDPKHEAKLAFLAGDATESTETGKKPEQKASKTGEQPAKDVAKPTTAAAGAPVEKPSDTHAEDDIPAEPKAAREAFARMRRELREAKAERETLAPDAELGREFHGILQKHQVAEDFNVVRDDEVAGVIKIQASLNRASIARANGQAVAPQDLAVIKAAISSLEPVAKDLGLERAPAPLQVQPFAGKLPDELQAIVDAQWLPEERLRKLFALELAQETAAKAATAAPAQQPPAPATDVRARQPAALPRRDAARELPPAQAADEQIYIGKSRAYLTEHGVAAGAAQAEHYKTKLVPIIVHDLLAARLPKGVDAVKTWLAASPQTKHDLVVEAQQVFEKRSAPPAPATTPKPEPVRQVLFQRNFARGPGRNRSTATPADPKGRLAFLSGEASQE